MKRLIVLVAAVFAGCGESARLEFDAVQVDTGARFIDSDWIQYVEVRPTGAPKPSFVARLDQIDGARTIAPGRYTVVSYARDCVVPCDGSPARWRSGHCQRRIRVAGGETRRLTITTQTGGRCAVGR